MSVREDGEGGRRRLEGPPDHSVGLTPSAGEKEGGKEGGEGGRRAGWLLEASYTTV